MSQRPTSRRPDIQRLVDEGFEIEELHEYILVHSVPYVTPSGDVATGTLVSEYGNEEKPKDHTVWFQGELPSKFDGAPLPHLVIDSTPQLLFDNFQVMHRFSNKLTDVPGFPENYYEKFVHYVGLLSAHARVLDPNAEARTGRAIRSQEPTPIFVYPDSASSRAGIVAIGQKVQGQRVAILGLGGTGGYILDQVAKTWVREIHLFDGKPFRRHNAFRAPGAASIDQLERKLLKVEYFRDVYSLMHTGIRAHAYRIDESNIEELKIFDFVFIAIDDGPSRGLICNQLADWQIPFVDTGMGLEKVADRTSLLGIVRATLVTPYKNDHLARRLPVADDTAEALYDANIQVADMNALNALLAVMKWKQFYRIYEDYDQPHHVTFSIAQQSLARAEITTT